MNDIDSTIALLCYHAELMRERMDLVLDPVRLDRNARELMGVEADDAWPDEDLGAWLAKRQREGK